MLINLLYIVYVMLHRNPGMESVLSEIDEAAEPGTKLSVLAKPQFAAKLKKQVSVLV
jgi:hypothetical protein